MPRLMIFGLAVLHLGPAVAFGIHAFGCDGFSPALGVGYCEPMVSSFVWTTVAAWGAMALAVALLPRRA